MEDALLKLSVVVSDLHGVSSREIMEALIGGCRDPKALAPLARGRMRAKIAALEEALDGADTFTDHHAFVLGMMLDNIDRLSAQIDKLTAQVEDLVAPFDRQVTQLDGVTGPGPRRRPGPDRRDRGGHGRVRHRRPPGVVGEFCPR